MPETTDGQKVYFKTKLTLPVPDIKGDIIHNMQLIEAGSRLQLIDHPNGTNYQVYELYDEFCAWYFERQFVEGNPHLFELIK